MRCQDSRLQLPSASSQCSSRRLRRSNLRHLSPTGVLLHQHGSGPHLPRQARCPRTVLQQARPSCPGRVHHAIVQPHLPRKARCTGTVLKPDSPSCPGWVHHVIVQTVLKQDSPSSPWWVHHAIAQPHLQHPARWTVLNHDQGWAASTVISSANIVLPEAKREWAGQVRPPHLWAKARSTPSEGGWSMRL